MAETTMAESLSALEGALQSVGLGTEAVLSDDGGDLVIVNPAGGRVVAQVKRLSLASEDTLPRRLAEWDKTSSGMLGIVVADRITAGAREVLNTAGWGWVDLRGHLHLAASGLFVDADVSAARSKPARSKPLSGQVGREAAALLLLYPDQPASVRQVARTLGRAASSISTVLTGLQAAGLLDDTRRPVAPELFWELARHWSSPAEADVQGVPSSASGHSEGTGHEVLRLGFQEVETTTGWALTDTMAAAAYGAPVGVRADYPPDFYVPDATTLRRAVHVLGAARSHDSRSATVRVAPVALACSRRINAPDETWPLAHPLFVALDLAQDSGRGREVLDGWHMAEGFGRVW